MLKLIEAATVEPVSLTEVRAQCNIEHTDDDALLSILMAAARQVAETIMHRQCVAATYERVLDAFPDNDDPLELPRPPLQSVMSVTYLDADGAEQTLEADTDFVTDTDSEPGRIYPAYGKTWPSTRDTLRAVRVRYVTGWPLTGTSPEASTTPAAIKAWVLQRVATLYEQRESLALGTIVAQVPRDFVDGLLDPYIIPEVV
ncbi:MAG: head-tail connector protein [Desulfovibrionaceae bacterium]